MNNPPCLIVGSGPAGLSLAAELSKRHVQYELLDDYGDVGGAYRRMAPSIELASPPSYLRLDHTPVRCFGRYATAHEYGDYLEEFAFRYRVVPRRAAVLSIGRSEQSARVRLDDGTFEDYHVVVLATGMFSFPHIPEVAGSKEALLTGRAIHASSVLDVSRYRGARILIVGGGMRGVEVAEQLARIGKVVSLSSRNGRIRTWRRRIFGIELRSIGYRIQPFIPVPLFSELCSGRVTFTAIDRGIGSLLSTGVVKVLPTLTSIDGDNCEFADGSKQEFDHIIFATGHHFKWPHFDASVAGANLRPNGGWVSRTPRILSIGFPCARRIDSSFIHGIKRDATLAARQIEKLVRT